jgi:DNA polymerase III epsilon subunit-like protein
MSGISYWIIDLETSGISSKYHEITELSIIKCDTKVQLTEFVRCEYPERANVDALMITKKTLADLDKGISKEQAVEKINQFLNEDGLTPAHRCLIAHNYSFDMRFLHALYEKVGQRCPADLWLCSMALTKAYAKREGIVKPKVNLGAACDLLGVKKLTGSHASKVDSRNTYLLWKNLMEDKKIDHLPFIKTSQHILSSSNEEQGLDPDLLDINE